MLFCSRADAMPESYLRYLTNSLRETFELPGTPIRVTLREKANPFAGQEEQAAVNEAVALSTGSAPGSYVRIQR